MAHEGDKTEDDGDASANHGRVEVVANHVPHDLEFAAKSARDLRRALFAEQGLSLVVRVGCVRSDIWVFAFLCRVEHVGDILCIGDLIFDFLELLDWV